MAVICDLLYVDLLYSITHNIIWGGIKMDALKVFANNLRKYRNRLGLSQESFAEKAGLHKTYISAIECGKRSIALDNIQKIADALGIETYLLFIDDTINDNNKEAEKGRGEE